MPLTIDVGRKGRSFSFLPAAGHKKQELYWDEDKKQYFCIRNQYLKPMKVIIRDKASEAAVWAAQYIAKRINEKYIQALNTGYYHGNLDGIFDILLRKYPDETWNEFAEKFISKGYESFYLQVHH